MSSGKVVYCVVPTKDDLKGMDEGDVGKSPTDLALTPSPFTPAPKFKPSPKLHPKPQPRQVPRLVRGTLTLTLNPNQGKCLVLFEEQAAATKAFGAQRPPLRRQCRTRLLPTRTGGMSSSRPRDGRLRPLGPRQGYRYVRCRTPSAIGG